MRTRHFAALSAAITALALFALAPTVEAIAPVLVAAAVAKAGSVSSAATAIAPTLPAALASITGLPATAIALYMSAAQLFGMVISSDLLLRWLASEVASERDRTPWSSTASVIRTGTDTLTSTSHAALSPSNAHSATAWSSVTSFASSTVELAIDSANFTITTAMNVAAGNRSLADVARLFGAKFVNTSRGFFNVLPAKVEEDSGNQTRRYGIPRAFQPYPWLRSCARFIADLVSRMSSFLLERPWLSFLCAWSMWCASLVSNVMLTLAYLVLLTFVPIAIWWCWDSVLFFVHLLLYFPLRNSRWEISAPRGGIPVLTKVLVYGIASPFLLCWFVLERVFLTLWLVLPCIPVAFSACWFACKWLWRLSIPWRNCSDACSAIGSPVFQPLWPLFVAVERWIQTATGAPPNAKKVTVSVLYCDFKPAILNQRF